VGAIGSGISALVAIFAAGVALRIGQQSTKLERERQHRVAVAASGLLLHELQELTVTARKLTQAEAADLNPESLAEFLSSLACPSLESCLRQGADFPLLITQYLAASYAAVGAVKGCIESLCSEAKGIPTIQRQIQELEVQTQAMLADFKENGAESPELSEIFESIEKIQKETSVAFKGKQDVADTLTVLLTRSAENLMTITQALQSIVRSTLLMGR
jgi:hypothetical protein